MAVQVHGVFFGRHTTLWAGNVFMFFVTDGALHLGRVSDRFDKEYLQMAGGASFLTLGLGGIAANETIFKPGAAKRDSLEAKYCEVEAGSPEFLALDKRSYTIKASDIVSGTLKSSGNGAKMQQRVGHVEFKMADGKALKFELASSLAPPEVEKLLRVVAPQLQGELK